MHTKSYSHLGTNDSTLASDDAQSFVSSWRGCNISVLYVYIHGSRLFIFRLECSSQSESKILGVTTDRYQADFETSDRAPGLLKCMVMIGHIPGRKSSRNDIDSMHNPIAFLTHCFYKSALSSFVPH